MSEYVLAAELARELVQALGYLFAELDLDSPYLPRRKQSRELMSGHEEQ